MLKHWTKRSCDIASIYPSFYANTIATRTPSFSNKLPQIEQFTSQEIDWEKPQQIRGTEFNTSQCENTNLFEIGLLGLKKKKNKRA